MEPKSECVKILPETSMLVFAKQKATFDRYNVLAFN